MSLRNERARSCPHTQGWQANVRKRVPGWAPRDLGHRRALRRSKAGNPSSPVQYEPAAHAACPTRPQDPPRTPSSFRLDFTASPRAAGTWQQIVAMQHSPYSRPSSLIRAFPPALAYPAPSTSPNVVEHQVHRTPFRAGQRPGSLRDPDPAGSPGGRTVPRSAASARFADLAPASAAKLEQCSFCQRAAEEILFLNSLTNTDAVREYNR